MKLRREDNVIVIAGRDKGKTGKIVAVLPKENKIVVENINVAKRHTKPSNKQPRGGILEITKPIDASKVMVIDPATGKPARIGYTFDKDGTKQRVFKVSPNQTKKVEKPKTEKPAAKVEKTDKVDKVEKKPVAKKAAAKESK